MLSGLIKSSRLAGASALVESAASSRPVARCGGIDHRSVIGSVTPCRFWSWSAAAVSRGRGRPDRPPGRSSRCWRARLALSALRRVVLERSRRDRFGGRM